MNSLFVLLIEYIKNSKSDLLHLYFLIKLVNNLKIAKIAVSLCDPATLIQHPQTMTHSAIAKEAKDAAGITDSMLRLSAGLENTKDLIDDFENAFKSL